MYDPSRLVEIMRHADVDALVACTRENVFYLSGFDPVVCTLHPYHGVCWVVLTCEDPTTIHVVHSAGEADQILDATVPVGECALYGTFFRETPPSMILHGDEFRLARLMSGSQTGETAATAIVHLITRLGLASSRIAVDEDGASAGLVREVTASLINSTIVEGASLLREARRVKTPSEVAALRAAAESIEIGIAACLLQARIGTSEAELARTFEVAVAAAGARPALTMLKIGRSAVGGQRRPLAEVHAKAGDILWFDCDVTKAGYWADVARVFAFGDDRRFRRTFDALFTGQRQAIDLIRPGMTGQQVFDLTMSLVRNAGFPEYRRNHVGHGIGLEPYERPILAPGNKDRIEVGMVICVETPYYEFGLGALHIEDPVLVGSDSNTILTQSSAEMKVIE